MQQPINDDITLSNSVTCGALNVWFELKDPVYCDVIVEICPHVGVDPIQQGRITPEHPGEVIQRPISITKKMKYVFIYFVGFRLNLPY